MAGMKNICGKIPLELHTKVRQEIEQREISTQQFIQQVIEEHFTEKGGQVSMAVRTLAVQVSEELFARFKAAVAKKGCRQKDFLIAMIERAIEEIEAEYGEEKASPSSDQGTAAETPPAEPESEETESRETDEPEETGIGEADEPMETETGETGEPEETESRGTETGETDEAKEAESEDMPEEESGEPDEPADSEEPRETDEPAGSEEPDEPENEEASEPEIAEADGAGQEPDDTTTAA